MQREFARWVWGVLLLPVFLLIGCSDDEASARIEQSPKAEPLFDTQRSALEEAKAAAGSAELRSKQYQARAKDIN